MEQEPKIEGKKDGSKEEALTLSLEAWTISEEIWNDVVRNNSTKIERDVADQFIAKAREAILALEKYASSVSSQENKQGEIKDAEASINSLKEEIERIEKGVEGIMK